MSHANLPNSFWAEAVATAVYLRNRSESSALKEDMTPYEKWYGRKPDVSHLRVFGCIAYSHIPDSRRRKLDKKAQKCSEPSYKQNQNSFYERINRAHTITTTHSKIMFILVIQFARATRAPPSEGHHRDGQGLLVADGHLDLSA